MRGRGSVDEYLEQTAIANPHVTLHYNDPEEQRARLSTRSTTSLPPEPKEIKPHPYGIELGRLVTMLKDTHGSDDRAVSDATASRASARRVARKICEDGQDSARGPTRSESAGKKPTRCFRRSKQHADCRAGDRLHFARSARS